MHRRWIPLALAAALAAGCRSEGTNAPDPHAASAAQPAAQPEPESVPALPLLVQKAPAPAEPAAKAAPSQRETQMAAIAKELEDAQNENWKAIESALGGKENPSNEDWQKAMQAAKDAGHGEPDMPAYSVRVHALLDADPTDLAAFKAIAWLLDNEREPGKSATLTALLEKHHMQRPELASLCRGFAQDNRPFLETMLARSPHRDVRGQACAAIAESYKNDLQMREYVLANAAKDRASIAQWMGGERLTALESLDVAGAQRAIETTYERVAKEFGDVKINAGTPYESTLGAAAESELYEIRNLAVGMNAPEIEGVDLDQVAFKLSDYRGKVVLLDFWGNW